MSIYTELLEKGVALDHHATDLYAKVTPASRAIVEAYEFRNNVKTFTSQIDGELWYDIPFAYEPEWNRTRQQE
jgi:hypothetical protein